MDGTDVALFPYLPYILQDTWEIGTSPSIVIDLMRKHVGNHANLKVLDLGCGKGAVSVKVAKAFGCHCHGIDAIPVFIDEAKGKAKEYGVEQYCHFEVGDIRTMVDDLKGFDIIVLGSIGPVFGNHLQTLTILKTCLTPNGLIILDDGYIENDSSYSHSLIQKKSTVMKHIDNAGMKLIDEAFTSVDEIKESDDFIFNKLKARCQELIVREPHKTSLFLDYIAKQEEENDVLETKITCSAMVIRKKKKIPI
ncbi:MAG: methyltransferase domain-containing protein [Chloroflexi bacterium]|jgi:ubiquinone/menaquinone biosynthesis C-methylase UbiE|nr:methyltransferase domain-containing protein [Chloroflexota bacterium]MBT7081190.1 methyltransferase domain-containing protein [Chloroflexota bacterium]MBT7290856.1 methyltransferase domain-containing protein [Chloroflexota bacterium]